MQREVTLGTEEGLFFTLKELTFVPEAPALKEAFTIRGKITLFKLPYLLPIWVLAAVTYPETWWEEILPIIGSPTKREVVMATGGTFEIQFAEGFLRKGEYKLAMRVYLGPTFALDSIVLPPAPSMTSEDLTFLVSVEAPAAWTQVEEVSGIVINASPGEPPAGWHLVQEVVGILINPGPGIPPAGWTLVETVSGILITPGVTPPPVGWNLVQEVSGIAVFPPKGQYTLTLAIEPAGTGFITANPSKSRYNWGEVVTLTAAGIYVAFHQWNFSYWDVDSEWLADYSPINFMVVNNHIITAHFV